MFAARPLPDVGNSLGAEPLQQPRARCQPVAFTDWSDRSDLHNGLTAAG